MHEDDEDDGFNQFKRSDVNPYERQRNDHGAYQFNPANETPSIPSDILQDVSTPNFTRRIPIQVSDKGTNTEKTISQSPPKVLHRGVWPSQNIYGGVSYRPEIPPKMVSNYAQVVRNELNETRSNPEANYKIVAPASAVPPKNIKPRMIQSSDDEESIAEIIEIKPKRQQPQKEIIIVKQTSIEQNDTSEEEPKPIENAAAKVKRVRRTEYVDSDEEEPHRAEPDDVKRKQPHRIEYVDAKEERSNRVVKQPQYEIVEDVIERVNSSSMEDFADEQKQEKKRGKKKHKKHGFGKVLVKHIKANH